MRLKAVAISESEEEERPAGKAASAREWAITPCTMPRMLSVSPAIRQHELRQVQVVAPAASLFVALLERPTAAFLRGARLVSLRTRGGNLPRE